MAGLAPRPALDEWYRDGKIDASDYLTLALAAGRSEKEARAFLLAAHAKHGQKHWPHPGKDVIEPSLPEYAAPTRSARRVPKRGNELRGHPLD